MRDLYSEIISEGETSIENMVLNKQQESVDLDFKSKAVTTNGKVDDNDKKVIGKVLSAFSNSMGGLIIWGVDAREDPATKIDQADSVKPISNIGQFKSDVNRLISQAIAPKHDGIYIEAIPSLKSIGSGYLAMYVERSERRPHRCEFGNKYYYKRSGTSSVPMEHFDIEDAFKRFTVPWIDIGYSVSRGSTFSGGAGGIAFTMYIDISVKNPSPVSAKFPYVQLRSIGSASIDSLSSLPGVSQHSTSNGSYFLGGADLVLHPSMELILVRLRLQVLANHLIGNTYKINKSEVGNLEITYSCGAEHSRQKITTLIIPTDELIKDIPPNFVM